MSRVITTVDIGTAWIKTVSVQDDPEGGDLRILGAQKVRSRGVRKGMVVDPDQVGEALGECINALSKRTGLSVKSVWVAVNGWQMDVSNSRGVVAVSRADGEISADDVRRCIEAAESFLPKNPNRETIHVIPRYFKVDSEPKVIDPVGMYGLRLEADVVMIESSRSLLKNLLRSVENAGLRAVDYVFSPLAAAKTALSARQRELGVLLIDIGAGTSSYVVYEDGIVAYAGVVPIGGDHITNDIAVGLRIPVDIAERVKCKVGSGNVSGISKKEQIKFAEFITPEDRNSLSERAISLIENSGCLRYELAEIIEARLRDIFELVQRKLKKIGRSGLLPGGVVITGGTGLTPGILETAKEEFHLPVDIISRLQSEERYTGEVMDKNEYVFFVPALGLVRWAKESSTHSFWKKRFPRLQEQNKLVKWLQSLLP